MRIRHRSIDVRLVVVVTLAAATALVLATLALRPASPPSDQPPGL